MRETHRPNRRKISRDILTPLRLRGMTAVDAKVPFYTPGFTCLKTAGSISIYCMSTSTANCQKVVAFDRVNLCLSTKTLTFQTSVSHEILNFAKFALRL